MKEQKTNMEILNEIRNKRNDDLRFTGRNDIFIVKVEVLGNGEKTNKTFFRLIENRDLIDPKTKEIQNEKWELFYEYENGPVLIGVKNPRTQEEIIPTVYDEKDKTKWEEEKQDIEKCIEEREKELTEIAKKLGIDEKEIESLSEIDLSQVIEEKEQEKNQQKSDEPKKLKKEEVEKVGMTGMNEVNLNSVIDERGTTLGQALKLDGYSKIMVVHSYKLAELTNSDGEKGIINHLRFGLIAQKSDGTLETLPETKLTPYRGENREVTEMDNKEDVEVKNEDCIYEVPGTDKRIVVNQKDPYGIPDVYLSQNTRDNDGNIAQKLQDKYDGTERQDIEVRAIFNQNKGVDQPEKSVEEARRHLKAGCKDLDIDEVDGRDETGHIHFEPQSQEQQNAIDEIAKRGNVSKEEAEDKLKTELENSREDISLEEAIENSIEKIEEEYRGNNSRNR